MGSRERLSIVEETSYGAGGDMAVNGEVIGYNAVMTPDFDLGWQKILTAGADSRSVQDRVTSSKSLPYSLSFVPYSWKWINYLFTIADASAGAYYTHTGTIANTMDSFKLEWARVHTTPSVIQTTGNVIKNAKISFQKSTGEGKEGFLNVEAECHAKDFTTPATVTDLAATDPTATTHPPWKNFTSQFTFEGTEIAEVNKGELMIDDEVDPEADSRYCNYTLSSTIGDPIPKTRKIILRMDISRKDLTWIDAWEAGTKLSGTNTLYFTQGTNDYMKFEFTELYVLKALVPTQLGEVSKGEIILEADTFSKVEAKDSISAY